MSKKSKKQSVTLAEEQKNVQNSSFEPEIAPTADETAQHTQILDSDQSPDVDKTEVEKQVDELVATPKKQRIWEVDFVRGLMILFVVWDHFMWDINDMGPFTSTFFNWLYQLSRTYYAGALRKATHDAFVTMFVFTSGISCSFSRNNGKRALKMISFAMLFTAATYAASAIMHANITIYFNVIHVIALSVLLWTAIEWAWSKCTKTWQKNVFGAVMAAVTIAVLVVGYCAQIKPWENDSSVWYFLAQHRRTAGFIKYMGGDYLSFFPDFGWFLVGAFLGRLLYKERKSIFPSVNPKYVSPITFCGKYSIWIYCGSQSVMYGLLYLLSQVLKWL